jgi:hypothetical protein
MEYQPTELDDSFMIATILQTDTLVRVIQRELKALYPNREIPQTAIRHVLREAVLCPELLSDDRIGVAQARLAQASALSARRRQSPAKRAFVAAQTNESEESLYDILWYDKTRGSCGG